MQSMDRPLPRRRLPRFAAFALAGAAGALAVASPAWAAPGGREPRRDTGTARWNAHPVDHVWAAGTADPGDEHRRIPGRSASVPRTRVGHLRRRAGARRRGGHLQRTRGPVRRPGERLRPTPDRRRQRRADHHVRVLLPRRTRPAGDRGPLDDHAELRSTPSPAMPRARRSVANRMDDRQRHGRPPLTTTAGLRAPDLAGFKYDDPSPRLQVRLGPERPRRASQPGPARRS